MKALILAAGSGTRLRRSNVSIPKCLLPLADGKTIVSHMVQSFIHQGLEEVVIVVGFKAELIQKELRKFSEKIKITYVYNQDYQATQACHSLLLALPYLDSATIMIPSDVVCNYSSIIKSLESKKTYTSLWFVERKKYSFDSMKVLAKNDSFFQATKETTGHTKKIIGESTGIIYLNTSAIKLLKQRFKKYCGSKSKILPYHTSVNYLRKIGFKIHLKECASQYWHEVDYPRHLSVLTTFTSQAFSA